MKRNDSVIQILSDLVAIDSQSYKGNLEIIDHLSKVFADYDQTTQNWVRATDGVKGKNLIVKIPGKSSDHSLVFVCHMDTVPTSSAWETDPFILEENGGNLYGLGACDTKGGVAALVEAVFTIPDKPNYDTYLVFDGDEEANWVGIEKYKKHLDVKNPLFICIEPSDGNLCIGARGIISFEVQTHGKTQHASYATPEINKKTSAIYKMYQVMDVLTQDINHLALEQDSVLGSNTQNFGVISGGNAQNVIPELCRLEVDRRILPHHDMQKEFTRIKKLIRDIDSSSSIVNEYVQNGFSTKISKAIENVLSSLQTFYPKAITKPFQAMTEGVLLHNLGEVIVLGPGSIQQAHIANEFVSSQELFAFVHVYQKIMQEIVL